MASEITPLFGPKRPGFLSLALKAFHQLRQALARLQTALIVWFRTNILPLEIILEKDPISFIICVMSSAMLVLLLILAQPYLNRLWAFALYLLIAILFEGLLKGFWLRITFLVDNHSLDFLYYLKEEDRKSSPASHSSKATKEVKVSTLAADTGEQKEPTTMADDTQAFKASASADGWGNNVLNKIVPTMLSMVVVCASIDWRLVPFALLMPVLIYGVREAAFRYFHIATGKELLDAKDRRNNDLEHGEIEEVWKSQELYLRARLSSTLGSYLRRLIWALAFFIISCTLLKHMIISPGEVSALCMLAKEIIAIDSYLDKLGKSGVVLGGMLDLITRDNKPRKFRRPSAETGNMYRWFRLDGSF